MFEKLYGIYGDLFNKFNEQGKDGYLIIKLAAPCHLLEDLYNNFLKQGIAPIGELSQEKKLKYWNIAKKYHSELQARLRATKAAYALSLITSTD